MSIKIDRIQLEAIINGEKGKYSLKELTQASKQLRAELNQLPVATKAFTDKAAELKKVNGQITKLNADLRGMGGAWQFVKDQAKSFGVMALGFLGFQFLSSQIGNVIRGISELSDSLADVRKTTGLTQDAVEELNRDLAKINTRTSRKELLELAVVAGKIGFSAKEDVLGFVKAADKLNVALGDELGGDGVQSLAKINDLFGQTKALGVEDSLIKAGSAINALGQAGTAAEGYLVDFAKRIAGVAVQSGQSLPEILGLATTLDELGQTSETSSTALSQLFIKMQKDSDTYAKIAGINVAEFNKTLGEDANEAFIQFLEGLQKNSSGLKELATNFSDLGIDGTRAIGVISALSQNTEKLREKQNLASAEYEKGTSVLNEYNTKNNNVAATIDKLVKKLNSFLTSGILRTIADGFVNLAGTIFGVTNATDQMVQDFERQSAAVRDLESNMTPLLGRYDELKEKTTLNKEEQDELQKIIDKVAHVIPSAVTEFDKYGKALGLNTDKAREYITIQQTLLKHQNEAVIKTQKEALRNYQSNVAELAKTLNQGYAEYVSAQGLVTKKAIDEAQKIKIVGAIDELNIKIADTKNYLAGLTGSYLDVATTVKANPIEPIITDTTKELTEEQLKDLEKAAKKKDADSKKELKDAEAQEKQLLAIKQRAYEDLLAESRKYRDLVIENMEAGAEKERAIEVARYMDEKLDFTTEFGERKELTLQQQKILEQMEIAHRNRLQGISDKYDEKKLTHLKKTGTSVNEIIAWENERLAAMAEANVGLWNASSDAVNAFFDIVTSNQEEGTKRAHDWAIAQKAFAAAIAAVQGALAVTAALAQVPFSPKNYVDAIAVGIAAAVQIGTILATKIPSYARGKITSGREVAEIGEDGPEAVIPLSPKYRQHAMPLFETAAEAMGFQFVPQRTVSTAAIAAASAGGGTGGKSDMMMMKMLYKNEKATRELIALLENGVPAYLEYNRFMRDLRRIEAVKGDA